MESCSKQQMAMAKERAMEKLDFCNLQQMQASLEDLSALSLPFTSLPLEILYQIFKLSDLKDLLSLSKVCTLFRNLTGQILQKRFKNFIYNYLTFKFQLHLQDSDISDLCCLIGRKVQSLRFSTYFNMDLLKDIEWKMGGNPMENLKFFVNDNFKQNLCYFPNLLELEVQGKFVQDMVFLELAKSCPKLRTIRLMDGDNRWLRGDHLAELQAIENLELKCCRYLDPQHLKAASEKRPLLSLNIVECEHLKDVPKMVQICPYWQHLQTLRLTAFTQDRQFLAAILRLPSLKCLQFFWINFMPLQFEENFFEELSLNQQKSMTLTALKFENDRYYIEDESLQQWTDESYAIMRENVCINGQSWQWSQEVFEKISKAFASFHNLSQLQFHYCRLLSEEQLEAITQAMKSLSLIKIFGCPRREDSSFLREWQQNMLAHNNCEIIFESFLSLQQVMKLQDDASSRQFSSYYRREPVMRSIECHFKAKDGKYE